ncbi:FAD:protein FMN transferase [Acidipropionibacterium acidipropionici]|uniref:FAD:protein FMN transferase n=1 Tax=Acidipropionibacterium acidipropionici TaxID=1748 RepID=UPI00110C16E3|nr:FAD:protein FMN transferase [Acidipropionibacterium acidipropionici]QCV96577.1 hypothetical protein FEZ30_16175 [Acidipropionibacterium acidipropionici]
MTTATTTSGQLPTRQPTSSRPTGTRFRIGMIDAPAGRRSVSETPVHSSVFATPLMQQRLPDLPLIQRCVFDVGDTAVCVTTFSRLESTMLSQVLHAARAEFFRVEPASQDAGIEDAGIDMSSTRAMAVDAAGKILDAAGVEDWCISAGGDVLTRGVSPMREAPWAVGITEPGGDALISQAVCGGDLRAVSTVVTTPDPVSPDAEEDQFRQVTVVAPDILTAQLWAGEIRDGGPSGLMLAIAKGLEVLAFGPEGRVWASSAFRSQDPEPEA